jgi:transcriptional regulator with XRE-family HTH domain
VVTKKKRVAPAKQSLGDRIRRYRLEKGLTQTQLGKEIGVSQRVVAYYEVKGISPPPELLVRIADALKVSTDTLLGRKKGADTSGGREPAGNVRRQRHLKRLDELPLYDRKAIFRIIDALADRHAKNS